MIRRLLSFKNLLNESSLGLNPHVNLFSRLVSSQISSIIFKLVMPLYKQNISTPIIKVRGYAWDLEDCQIQNLKLLLFPE